MILNSFAKSNSDNLYEWVEVGKIATLTIRRFFKGVRIWQTKVQPESS